MKTRTQELTGPALDWAVAHCEGYSDAEMLVIYEGKTLVHHYPKWNPSTNWLLAAPIIEQHMSRLESFEDRKPGYRWEAECEGHTAWGDKPLLAAMRSYVLSQLGDMIDVPDEIAPIDISQPSQECSDSSNNVIEFTRLRGA